LEAQALLLPRDRQYISREDYVARYGAQPADVDRVTRFTTSRGLETVSVDVAAREIRVRGTAAKFNHAFTITLLEFRRTGADSNGTFYGYAGPIHIPADLESIIRAILGLDDRPVARTRGGTGRGAE
jgi:kumamolisin